MKKLMKVTKSVMANVNMCDACGKHIANDIVYVSQKKKNPDTGHWYNDGMLKHFHAKCLPKL